MSILIRGALTAFERTTRTMTRLYVCQASLGIALKIARSPIPRPFGHGGPPENFQLFSMILILGIRSSDTKINRFLPDRSHPPIPGVRFIGS